MLNIKTLPNIFRVLLKRKSTNIFIIVVASAIILASAFLGIYTVYFNNKILPNVFVSKVKVSGLSKNQAVEKIGKIDVPDRISITNSNTTFELPLSEIDFSYDFEKTVENAFTLYKTGGNIQNIYLALRAPFVRTFIQYSININKDKLTNNLSVIAEQITEPAILPSASLVDGEVIIENGSAGTDLNLEELQNTIINNLKIADFNPVYVNTYVNDPSVSNEKADSIRQKAQFLIEKNLTLSFENENYFIDDSQLVSFLGFSDDFNSEKIHLYITELKSLINRNPQNPVFVFKNGKVIEFAPAKDGVKVKEEELANQIKEGVGNLLQGSSEVVAINIPFEASPPDYQTSDINDLGINELIGHGTSEFKGSIASRVHNIILASSHFNGVLVKPGETFSFNATVGDVSQLTGYKQAYIISDGKTVLGDGGGLCQVSTTLFRAALNAGLPIVERRAHSYRVGYYEQDSPPGIDATVYSPTTDLKIKNDTENYLLIQTIVDSKKSTLEFDIYGTSDGRVSTISKPVVYDVSPPPEDLYQDDPTLPVGQVKQVDWKAWGAKVKFDYTVSKFGQVVYEKSFYSNYRPWQSVFLRGTAPAI
jgi:vancomycin resistance protein YoaR